MRKVWENEKYKRAGKRNWEMEMSNVKWSHAYDMRNWVCVWDRKNVLPWFPFLFLFLFPCGGGVGSVSLSFLACGCKNTQANKQTNRERFLRGSKLLFQTCDFHFQLPFIFKPWFSLISLQFSLQDFYILQIFLNSLQFFIVIFCVFLDDKQNVVIIYRTEFDYQLVCNPLATNYCIVIK